MIYFELEKKHIPQLAELYIRAFNSPPWNDEWTTDTATRRLLQMLNCEGFYGLVCIKDEDLVGMILGNHEYYFNGMHFIIKEFCVEINLRGNGIGSALLSEFLTRLERRGINEAILFTSRQDGTEGYYKKRGFRSFDSMVMMGKVIK